MKLLTHNMLSSKCIKGVKKGYPLEIVARDVILSHVKYDKDVIWRMLPKLDYPTVWKAADSIGHGDKLPKEIIGDMDKEDSFLEELHHVLFEIEVTEGELICPETGRRFPITKGVPNMLLNEDEV